MGYEPMESATVVKTISLKEAVAASVASFADKFRQIIGSEPIVEQVQLTPTNYKYTIATYGGGTYQRIAAFSMGELFGCCGIVVFYHASVSKQFQSMGLGTLLLEVREQAATKAGYTMAQATVLASDDAELAMLGKTGWSSLLKFKNQRTANAIVVMFKELNRT
jgi:GNAT superfamily N-acetyltransferase